MSINVANIVGEPWSLENFNSIHANTVPTNNHPETLNLLSWTVQEIKPKIIWEFGPWMGHTTVLMAAAAGQQLCKIYSCDNFKWQKWMDLYSCGIDSVVGASFLEQFQENTKDYGSIVHGIQWNMDLGNIPAQMRKLDEKPDFVFVDFTRDAVDLENLWGKLSPFLTPNSTVLIFNWIWERTEDFFKTHAHELKPFANYGVAGAFLFVRDIE